MKRSIINAGILLAMGLIVLGVGAILKAKKPNDEIHSYVFLGGLSLVFIGTVWAVLGLYRRKKD